MLRVLELFCGIGGCAAALGGRGHVVTALDINRQALDVYSRNFPHPVCTRTLVTLPASVLADWRADLWWLSPPCQPFTLRGRRRDADDPRARPFLAVLERIADVRPRYLALENVPGFVGSQVHGRLHAILERSGYQHVDEYLLCPSELGFPNRRQRYYLVASTDGLVPTECLTPEVDPETAPPVRDLLPYLDLDPDPRLTVDPRLLRRYQGALHLVDADDPLAVTNCFTSAYGRSHVRSGSYLKTPDGARRFSPTEILRLLGFPASFTLPAEMPATKAWRLVGNSLSLGPVQRTLARIPELRTFSPAPAS